jgi:hypothetical protein
MPFKSKTQWKWAWVNKKRWARKWSHETPSYKRLPRKKK